MFTPALSLPLARLQHKRIAWNGYLLQGGSGSAFCSRIGLVQGAIMRLTPVYEGACIRVGPNVCQTSLPDLAHLRLTLQLTISRCMGRSQA